MEKQHKTWFLLLRGTFYAPAWVRFPGFFTCADSLQIGWLIRNVWFFNKMEDSYLQRVMYPYGVHPLAPIDPDSWHCYLQNFVPNSQDWLKNFLETEAWEKQHLLINRRMGKEWVQGHRKWVFQSDFPDKIIYRFSGIEFRPQPYSNSVGQFVDLVRRSLAECRLDWFEFNSVLMYLYDTPDTYCRNHREDEPELGENPSIGYLGLGDRRCFVWSAETRSQFGNRKDSYKIEWNHGGGDLLIMGGTTQQRWYHAIQAARPDAMKGPRIGCLFLNIIPGFHE